MKILVAEDEANIAESYKLMLEFKGHEVTLTGDGEKCIDVYKRSLSSSPPAPLFDLVILDYRMPKKDGVQVAQEILGIVPAQRILLATAFVQDLSISRLREIPITKTIELIQKPFDFDSFLNIVQNHVYPNADGTRTQKPGIGNVTHGNNNPSSTGWNNEAAAASAMGARTLSSSTESPFDLEHLENSIETLERMRANVNGDCNGNRYDAQNICQAEDGPMRMIF